MGNAACLLGDLALNHRAQVVGYHRRHSDHRRIRLPQTNHVEAQYRANVVVDDGGDRHHTRDAGRSGERPSRERPTRGQSQYGHRPAVAPRQSRHALTRKEMESLPLRRECSELAVLSRPDSDALEALPPVGCLARHRRRPTAHPVASQIVRSATVMASSSESV